MGNWKYKQPQEGGEDQVEVFENARGKLGFHAKLVKSTSKIESRYSFMVSGAGLAREPGGCYFPI